MGPLVDHVGEIGLLAVEEIGALGLLELALDEHVVEVDLFLLLVDDADALAVDLLDLARGRVATLGERERGESHEGKKGSQGETLHTTSNRRQSIHPRLYFKEWNHQAFSATCEA